MRMAVNLKFPLKDQIPMLEATELFFGPQNDPKYRMVEAAIWCVDGSDCVACRSFRRLAEAKAWMLRELKERPAGLFEGETTPFLASAHDYLLFDREETEIGGSSFRDECVLRENDPHFQSQWKLENDKLEECQ